MSILNTYLVANVTFIITKNLLIIVHIKKTIDQLNLALIFSLTLKMLNLLSLIVYKTGKVQNKYTTKKHLRSKENSHNSVFIKLKTMFI